MTEFVEQLVAGLAAGGIYASLALALVIIYRAMGLINFAQGEFAMLAAFICWALPNCHLRWHWQSAWLRLPLAPFASNA